MVVQCDREAQLQHLLTGLSIIETGDQYNLPSTPRSLFVTFGQLTTMILLSLNTRWVISFLFHFFCPFAYHMAKKNQKTWRKIKMYLWIAFAVCSRKQPDTYRSVGGATANQSVLHGGSLKYFFTDDCFWFLWAVSISGCLGSFISCVFQYKSCVFQLTASWCLAAKPNLSFFYFSLPFAF